MNKNAAIKLLKEKYPNLIIDVIIDDDDRFIAQLVSKSKESIIGGIKAVYKESKQVTDINPLKINGLVKRLMEGKRR